MGKKSKILIVDDDERNLRLMEALLVPEGYEVIKASDGIEALDKVKEDPPDLVLLDIMMPNMDGYEVAAHLKRDEDTSRIPIVMVTALEDADDRVRALEAGADDFLSKPVDKTELRTRVRTLLKAKAYDDHMRDYQASLEAEVETRTYQLKNAFEKIKTASLDTILKLSKAAEYRDEETGEHILRMSRYSGAVAKRMGLNEKTVEAILYASPMHDVGKIGIPDKILLKPGKFDSQEWEVMKMHTVIGGRILSGSSSGFIKLAETIAMTHHEKWDGSGYPKGLKGNKIPLAGRIVTIADVFDALTSVRPYKRAFSVEESFSIIRDEKGSHFDPCVVDAFFAVQEEILVIKDSYKDTRESLLFEMANIAGSNR
jgi:putative two-component system response regulator